METTLGMYQIFLILACLTDIISLLMVKGAPDILLPRCDFILNKKGEEEAFGSSQRLWIEGIKDAWSRQGKRVILLAQKSNVASVASQEKEVLASIRDGLTLVGIVGIVDPPRDEIPEVVRILRGASIRIFMVTGDFKLTAQAIAEECGIISNSALVDDIGALDRYNKATDKTKQAIVLSGPELITLNECQWDQLCDYQEIVFARTTPEQKLRIVKEFQARENIVGMTGDGVNDAPSLKAAEIGIAMGGGSDIAIEAADMVLLDSFAAIVEAVKYGRLVYDNLKKTIVYLLPAGSFSELWPVVTNVVFGIPQILSSFLMVRKPQCEILKRKLTVPDYHLLSYRLRRRRHTCIRETRSRCLASPSPQPQEGQACQRSAHLPCLLLRRSPSMFPGLYDEFLVDPTQWRSVQRHVPEVWRLRPKLQYGTRE